MADSSNRPSTRVTIQTQSAGFGNCHRVKRPSEVRNHQEADLKRAKMGLVVVEEVQVAGTQGAAGHRRSPRDVAQASRSTLFHEYLGRFTSTWAEQCAVALGISAR